MASCDRCNNLSRLLTDERKEHEATRMMLKRERTTGATRKKELKEYRALVDTAIADMPSLADAIAGASRQIAKDTMNRNLLKGAARRADNR